MFGRRMRNWLERRAARRARGLKVRTRRDHIRAAIEAEAEAESSGNVGKSCGVCERRLVEDHELAVGYCSTCWTMPDEFPDEGPRAPRIGDNPRSAFAGRGVH